VIFFTTSSTFVFIIVSSVTLLYPPSSTHNFHEDFLALLSFKVSEGGDRV
jgi:hypothetical protein